MSPHPYVGPEPMALEPTESYSREDLDAYAAILAEVAREAYEDRDHLLAAPHASTIHRIDHAPLDDPSAWAIAWRAYRRKRLGGGPPGRRSQLRGVVDGRRAIVTGGANGIGRATA